MKRKITLVLSAAAMAVVQLNANLWAMGGRPPDPDAPPPPAWVQWFPILVMVAVFYFLLIRPQMRHRRERDAMLGSVKKGDRIVTQGGLIATVVNVGPDVLDIKLNDETKVKLRRQGVAEVLRDEAAAVVAKQ